MRTTDALRAGWVYTASRWPSTLLTVAAAIAEALAGVALLLALLAGGMGGKVLIAGVGGALAAGVLARLCMLTALAGAVRSGSRWVTARPEEPPFEAALAALPTAASFFAFSIPIDLAFFLWKWLGLAALVAGLGGAVTRWSGVLGESGAIALFVCVSIVLFGFDLVWRKAALARAVAHQQGVARSLFEAFNLLADRFWPRFAAAFLPLIVAGGAALFFNIVAGTISSAGPSGSLELQLVAELAAGVPSAFIFAIGELVALQALAALDLPNAPAATPM